MAAMSPERQKQMAEKLRRIAQELAAEIVEEHRQKIECLLATTSGAVH